MSNFTKLVGYEWTPFYETIASRRSVSPRTELEDEIERLIELLNCVDGDCDFEPNGDDEHTLGWHERFGQWADIEHARLTGGAS